MQTWVWPAPGLGTLIALVVLIFTLVFAFLHMLELRDVLIVCALCSWKL